MYTNESDNPSLFEKKFIIKQKSKMQDKDDEEIENIGEDDDLLASSINFSKQLLCFMDIMRQFSRSNEKSLTVLMKPESDKPEEYRIINLTLTSLLFNHEECRVLTFRDVTEVKKAAKIQEANKILSMLTSTVTHELLTPLKCMISFAASILKELKHSPKKHEAELIFTTAKLLLS